MDCDGHRSREEFVRFLFSASSKTASIIDPFSNINNCVMRKCHRLKDLEKSASPKLEIEVEYAVPMISL